MKQPKNLGKRLEQLRSLRASARYWRDEVRLLYVVNSADGPVEIEKPPDEYLPMQALAQKWIIELVKINFAWEHDGFRNIEQIERRHVERWEGKTIEEALDQAEFALRMDSLADLEIS